MQPESSSTPSTVVRRGRLQFRLRSLCIAVAAVSLLLAGYSFYQRQVRVAEQRREAGESFHQVAIGFMAYSTGTDVPPPARSTDAEGNVLHSWRTLLLRDLEAGSIDFCYRDLPWTHPLNSYLRSRSYDLYCFANANDPKRKLMTCMSAITGPGTAFDEDQRTISDIDGDLVWLVEVRNSGVHWMQPWDLDIATMPREINPVDGPGISGNLQGGFFVAFLDTTVWFLDDDTPFDKLAMFFTTDGAKQNDREDILGPYKIAWDH